MSFRYVIADDAPFIREIIKQTYNQMGAQCVGEASNGEECIALVNVHFPDYVILDMVMPQMNGVECAKIISQAHPEVQIIACSTLQTADIKNMLNGISIKKIISKPFTKDQLIDAVS